MGARGVAKRGVTVVGFIALVVACRAPADNCTTTLTYGGKVVRATGRSRPLAESMACGAYCIEHDPDLRASYEAWRATPVGRSSAKSREEAMRTEVPMHLVQQRCALRCTSELVSGRVPAATTCKRTSR